MAPKLKNLRAELEEPEPNKLVQLCSDSEPSRKSNSAEYNRFLILWYEIAHFTEWHLEFSRLGSL